MNSESLHNQATAATQEQLQFIADMLADKNYAAALAKIEQIPVAARTPLLQSAYALCLAEVKQTFKAAVNLCHDAIKKDPKTPEHYSRQGRILLLAGRRKDAIWILRMGLRHGRHRGIIDTLGSLGIRRPPPLTMLSRGQSVEQISGEAPYQAQPEMKKPALRPCPLHRWRLISAQPETLQRSTPGLYRLQPAETGQFWRLSARSPCYGDLQRDKEADAEVWWPDSLEAGTAAALPAAERRTGC